MQYVIRRATGLIDPAADFDAETWRRADTVELKYDFNLNPENLPDVRAKLLWDDDFIYGRFKVDDLCARAAAKHDQDAVCQDSCVEFFVRPSGSDRYFNFEMNCRGVLLLYHITHCRSENFVKVAPEDLAAVRRFPTLPPFEGELAGPVSWQLGFAIPLTLFAKYGEVERVSPAGQIWHGNFTNCADRSSRPHWLSWRALSRKDFHLPDEFGELRFDC